MIIEFTREAWDKINLYIKHCDKEISGLGIGSLDKNENKIVVKDVRIWEQECTSAWTEVKDNEEFLKLVNELTKEKVPMQDMCIWWHSHADMSATFSGKDKETICNWLNNNFMAAVVGNKSGDFDAMIAMKKPFKHLIENIEVKVEPEYYDEKMIKAVQKDIKDKVKEKEYDYKKYKDPHSNYHCGYIDEEDDYPEMSLINIDTLDKNELAQFIIFLKSKQGKKTKIENLEVYKEGITEFTKEQKKKYLRDSAAMCGCDECIEYLGGDTQFPFENHWFDSCKDYWQSIKDLFKARNN